MNKEFLLEKIKSLVNCSNNEKEVAFQFLVKSILSKINEVQAIKIKGLGIFQLKNEPLLREERKKVKTTESSSKTLIYAPFYDDTEKEFSNLFLNIDLDNSDFKDYHEVDNAFSLGFGKPTIPIFGQDSNKFLKKIKDYKIKSSFEETITRLIQESEVLDDFNIFSDHIEKAFLADESKELKEESIQNLLSDAVLADEVDISNQKTESEKEPEILDEELSGQKVTEEAEKQINPISEDLEITDESIEKLFSDEELEKVFVEETEIHEKTESENSLTDINSEETIEDNIQEKENIIESEIAPDEIPEEDSKRKTMFDKLDAMLTKPDAENIVDEIISDELPDSGKEEISEKIKTEVQQTSKKGKYTFYKSVIFWFLAVFIIVLAVSLYLITPDYFSSKSDIAKKNFVQKEKGKVQTPTLNVDSSEAKNDSTAEISLPAKEEKSFEDKSLYRTPAKDMKISNQIFYDGKNYTVQVSSWLDKSIAENEVKKLRARGFDAFIYQVYVASKGSTWSRVRIGNFKSSSEAESFLIKNQLKE
jgi:cell division septation protein DedD/nucleoid DNA-binding protein